MGKVFVQETLMEGRSLPCSQVFLDNNHLLPEDSCNAIHKDLTSCKIGIYNILSYCNNIFQLYIINAYAYMHVYITVESQH